MPTEGDNLMPTSQVRKQRLRELNHLPTVMQLVRACLPNASWEKRVRTKVRTQPMGLRDEV